MQEDDREDLNARPDESGDDIGGGPVGALDSEEESEDASGAEDSDDFGGSGTSGGSGDGGGRG
jgi:hypothetical protein